jgi:hypothetical protein
MGHWLRLQGLAAMQASLFDLKDPIFCVDPAAAGQLISFLF